MVLCSYKEIRALNCTFLYADQSRFACLYWVVLLLNMRDPEKRRPGQRSTTPFRDEGRIEGK